jgi:thioredoxin-dependent peroxiredoxin
MKLTAGMIAPDFTTEDIFGNPIALKNYAGKGLLLSFFRNGACAMCNLQVHRLIQKYPEYKAQGLEVLAIFESPRESVLTHVSKQDAPFPIIADPTAALYDLYGLESSEEKVMAPVEGEWREELIKEASALGYPLQHEEGSNFFRLPADFLIGPDQRIVSAFYVDVIGQHISFDEIDQFLKALA